ncbi:MULTISPECIES: PqqD family protein [unclassified Kitasatospora]|uniref:PqqD family protein n=1 Tax=unclassified Kitasatospora TaxID=2633591 RepID=UPI0033DD2371
MIEQNWIPKRTTGLFTRRSDTGTLIETYHDAYETNQVGAFIWSQCGVGLSVEEIVARTAEKYEAGLDEVRDSVVGFVTDLRAKGFLE